MSQSIGCGVGTLLLQPQRVRRATTADPDQALMDDFCDLAVRLIGDASHGGTLFQEMGDAVQAAAQGLLHTLADRLETAWNHLQSLLSPLGHRVQAIVELFGQTEAPLDLLKHGLEQFEALAKSLEGLTIDQVRQVATAFVTVMETDLGLSSTAMEDMAWGLVTDVIDRIDHPDPKARPGPEPPEATAFLRQNRRQLVSVLRRMERRFRSAVTFPAFDAEAIARDAFDHISHSQLGPALSKVSCQAHNLATAAESVESILGAIPFTGFGSRSLGAAAAKPASHGYLWYPSWLLASKDLGFPLPWNTADIWKGDDGKIYRRDQVLFDSATFDWTSIPSGDPSKPPFHYTFRASPDVMEKVAWVTAWLADAGEITLHLVHASTGDNVSDYIHSGLLTGDFLLELAGGMPWLFWIRHGAGVGQNFGAWMLAEAPVWATVLGGSFQGFHTKAARGPAFRFWIILLAFDVMNAIGASTLPSLLRDALLAIITLINYDGPGTAPTPDNRPENRTEVDGIIGLTSMLMGWLSVKVFPREEYSIAGLGTAKFWVVRWLIIGGVCFGMLGGLSGVLVADAFARTFDVGVFVKKSLLGMVKAFLTWPFLLYGFRENDTDGGKYNPSGLPFKGYPPKDSSPYKLPYEKDKPICCVQGNQGFFSHHYVMPPTPPPPGPALLPPVAQVYSYDLALDQEDEILLARDGVVVDWFDWVPDDDDTSTAGDPALSSPGQTTQQSWNFILIRHDSSVDLHDRDADGAAATTYSVYGHGRQGSVRRVFSDRGIPPANIIGTALHQGNVIMLAGSTGNSFHNHVHVEVRSGPPPATPVVAVPLATLNRWTIPFVFKEDSLGSDGVPKSKTFYKSSNEKVA